MIYFLYGEDTYRSRKKMEEIIILLERKSKVNLLLNFFDGEKDDFQKVKNELQSNSIFKEKKVIILNNSFSSADFYKEVIEFFKEKKIKDIIIFYEKGKADKRSSLFTFLKKTSKSHEFNLLTGKELEKWVYQKLEEKNLSFNVETLNLLIEFIGNDLWRFSSEIDKLSSFKAKDSDSEITSKEINLLIRSKIETDIFKTIDAIASKDKKKALGLLHSHLEKGDSPIYLFSMIRFQLKNLLTVKDLDQKGMPYSLVLSDSGLHPFVARKSYNLSQKFSLEKLKQVYWDIFKLEIKIKTGKIDPSMALDLLIAGM
jgi:DNA polymerase III subunit delta